MKKTKIRNIALLFITIFLLSSCYTQKSKRLFQESSSLPQYRSSKYQEYKIKVNDELIFKVTTKDDEFLDLIGLNNMNFFNSYRVYADGTIDIPFLDSIKIAGKTIPEATERIQREFKQIIRDAEIKIALKNKSYTVIGEGGKGIFPIYKDRMNIYQALAQSGQIPISSDRKHIKIIRETNGKPQILEFDIRPLSVINSKYYYVYPNDIIYIPKDSKSFYKTASYAGFIGLISSSISFFSFIYYFTKTEFNK